MTADVHPRSRAPRHAPPFLLKVTPDRDRVVIAPVGELDMNTCDEVSDQIEELRRAGFDRIVLDLRALTFMDSSALRVIARAREASLRDGFDFALIDGQPAVCRVLDITGLRDHLEFAQP